MTRARLPLPYIARIVGRPWWSRDGWLLLTARDRRGLLALRDTVRAVGDPGGVKGAQIAPQRAGGTSDGEQRTKGAAG